MQNRIRTIDVFTPTTPAKFTFVERKLLASQLMNALRAPGKRLVWLSITHKLSTEDKSQLDICEAREASPHDEVSWRRILCASQIASETSELSQVEGERIG